MNNKTTLLSFVKRFTEYFSNLFANSVIVSFFSYLFSEQSVLGKSGLVRFPHKKNTITDIILKIRLFFAGSFENSSLLKFAKETYKNFQTLPLRTIAVFLLTYGVILISSSAVSKDTLSVALSLDSEKFYIGIVILAASVIMLPIKKNIYHCINNSSLLSRFVINDNYRTESTNHNSDSKGYSSAFFLGVVCGVASLFISSADILLIILAALCTCAVFNKPETGIILLTALLPILGTGYIIYIVFITFVSYILKYLRGKRHLNTRGVDVLLFLALGLILFSGVVTAGNGNGISHAIKFVFCFITAILASNLIRSTRTSLKCVSVLIGSAFAVALFNIVFFILQYTKISDEIARHFSVTEIIGILNIFSGKDELGIFAASMVPLVFSFIASADKNKRSKHILLFSMLFLCIVISGSGIAFCTSIFCVIVVLTFKSKAYSALIIPYLIFIKFLYSIPSLILGVFSVRFPSDVLSDKQSITKPISDLLSDYGMFGTGLGEENLSSVFSGYFPSGSAQSTSSGNMPYQILLTLGVFGLLFIVLFIISFLSVPLRYIKSDEYKDKQVQTVCIGLLSSSICFVALSLMTYTASDTRLIMYFMLIMGLAYSTVTSSRNDHISEYVIREHLPHY